LQGVLKTTNEMNRVILSCLAILSSAGLSAQTPTEIRSAEELAALNNSKESYRLMNDLTLNDWIPIADFSGTFDGSGHTIILTGFRNIPGTKIGLFASVEKGGVVKNLCLAGNVGYTSNQKILYIGGIAGVNFGLISCCVSRMALEGSINTAGGKPEKVKGISGYEAGAYGGCIAGINKGIITNCYTTGSILISGDIASNFAGGIAGGNGQPVQGSIGISIGPGGGGISATPGMVKVSDVISCCYTTASVFSVANPTTTGFLAAASGGITAHNHPTGWIGMCVSLNKTIVAKGTGKIAMLSAVPIANTSAITYSFYNENIDIHKYKDGAEQKPNNYLKRYAINFPATQESSWWRYPDGLTAKQRLQTFGFPFGEDEQSPWVWNDVEKLPALYWENKRE